MTSKHTKVIGTTLLFAMISSGIIVTSPSLEGNMVRVLRDAAAHKTQSGSMLQHKAAPTQDMLLQHKSERLQERIQKRFGVQLSSSTVKNVVTQRQKLLMQHLTVNFTESGSMAAPLVWDASPAAHPDWISFQLNGDATNFHIDPVAVSGSLSYGLPLNLPAVVDAVVTSSATDDLGIERVAKNQMASAGYELDLSATAGAVTKALLSQQSTVSLPIIHRSGTITVQRNGKMQVLTLLSTGRSDYRTSPWGRKENIRKAIEEQVEGVIIPQGQEFSFNQTLGGPITKSRGWVDSLIIVNGSTLEPAPGGGICQAATTTYRAALLAGLPIEERAPHSLYVHYYELFGVGLDATVFPGAQDLNFTNNTPGDLVIQSSTHDTEVSVEFYGVADGRSVAFDGPFFSSTAPDFLTDNKRPLRSNEIGWTRHITNADGTITDGKIVSAYGQMPSSLFRHYTEARGTEELLSMPAPTVAMQ